MMLGYLLARAGIDVLVLEKHADFLRDFRGDTVHPSTLTVLDELGLLERFLMRPHQTLRQVKVQIGNHLFQVGDFGRLRTKCPYIAFMPQWDFLDFLAEQAVSLPRFRLLMSTEATKLMTRDNRVAGLRAQGPEGELRIRADLVIAADGRSSILRQQAGLKVLDVGAPIDVLWFRVGKGADGAEQTLGRIDAGRVLITIDRGDYWQCAYAIRKGAAEALKAGSLESFRQAVVAGAPYLNAGISALASWEDVRVLSVAVDRLERWSQPGLLCIGDAAHAMSPVGGVGINMAIQDAVAAANLLAGKLRSRTVTDRDLDAVRRRRLFPTRVTQAFQVFVQKRVLLPILSRKPFRVPLVVRALDGIKPLQWLPARFVGIGVRPEHVQTPAWELS
ncbi:MAG: FAD-dependent oxidoreductase [Devosia sp.]|nr:FAD-dependent oxidoreductase [Devosia sp.]